MTDRRTPDDLQEAVAATLRRLRGEVRAQNQPAAQQRNEPQLSAPSPTRAPTRAPIPSPMPSPTVTPVAQREATPAVEPDLLSGSESEIPPAPSLRPLLRETQTSFLEAQSKKSRLRLVPYALSFVALVVFAGIVWWAYHAVTGAQKNGPVPVIAADQTPEKVPPADQNATETPAPDKTVYDQISGTNSQPKTEVLLPAPATPQVPPPAPAPAPSMPAATGTESGVPPAAPAAPAAQTAPSATATPAVPPVPAIPAAPAAPAAPATTATAGTMSTTPTTETTGTAASTADLSGVPTLSPLTPTAPAVPAPSTETTTASGAGTSSTTTSTATTPTQTAAIPDNYRIQVAATKSEADANNIWKRILSKHQDVLGSLTVHIVRADLGAQGIYYRVQAGPFADRESAGQACEALKAQGQQCLVKP